MTSSAHLEKEASSARAGLSNAIDDLKSSVTTTAITNGAMTLAKEGSSAVARAAIDRAMASPFAAMLIGAGIVMLMAGNDKGSKVGEVAAKGNDVLRSAASTLAGMGSGIASAASGAMSAASRASGAVADTASSTADKVKGAAHDASAMASGAYDKAKGMAGDLTDQGREQVEHTQAMVAEAQGRLEQFARDQPILVAALGVAFGAALGASLPMTKAEQDYMGEAARKAGAIGTDIAKKVADSVTQEVSGGDVKAKVGALAEKVTSTVATSISNKS
ncbi:hypothetical protein BH10PSE6_BH10PSE6_19610 [soil metagenome]